MATLSLARRALLSAIPSFLVGTSAFAQSSAGQKKSSDGWCESAEQKTSGPPPKSVVKAATAETQYVEADGVRFAYRRFGVTSVAPPIVFLQRFRGTMDDWDPLFIDEIANEREIILFDNAGVGLSSGEVPPSNWKIAEYAAAFINELKIGQVDLHGWSMGGYAAQALALEHPEMVRRLVLSGTGPGGGEGTETRPAEVSKSATGAQTEEHWMLIMFAPSDTSRAAGIAHLRRLQEFKKSRPSAEREVRPESMRAQFEANNKWATGVEPALPRLASLTHPVLIGNGAHDVMVPTVNSWVMFQRIPNAKLALYPNAGHAFLFQYAKEYAQEVLRFLA
jgi:pimeloyl-ACP methyl ester carboxylesterase